MHESQPRRNFRALSIRKIAIAGILSALTIVMGVIPGLGFIPVPNLTLSATTNHIPTILGSILEGPIVGTITGFVFGLISFLRGTGPFADPFVAILPRLFIGLTSWLVFAALKKVNRDFAAALAGAVGSLTNTVLVVMMLILRGYTTPAIIVTIWPQAIAELVVASVISVVIARVFFVIEANLVRASDTKARDQLPY